MLQLLLQISSQDILYTAQHELQLIKLSAIMTESLSVELHSDPKTLLLFIISTVIY